MGGVLLVLVTIVASVVVGLVRGGDAGNLAQAGLRLVPLLVLGAVLSLGAAIITTTGAVTALAPWLSVLGMVCLLVFALANLGQPGMLLIALGVASNLLVFLLNGGMPVTGTVLDKAGIDAAAGPSPQRPDALHVRAEGGSLLPFLGDLLAVRPLRTAVSIGDIAQYAGLFLLVQGLMVRGPRAGRVSRYELFDYRVR